MKNHSIALVACAALLLSACATKKSDGPPPSALAIAQQARPGSAAAVMPVDSPRAEAERAQLFPGTGNFVKTAPAATSSTADGETYVLNYEGADLREVAWNVLGVILKENYTVHPAVQGSVTLRTSKAIPRSALLPTLETLLRQYGAALVREDGLYKVMPAAFAIRGSVTPQLGLATMPLPKGLSVQVVPLKWISAREMWKLLEPIVTDPTVMRIDESRNLLLLAGTEAELRHLLGAIELFDADYLAGMSMGLFTLRSADARTLAQELSQLFGDVQAGPLAGVVRIISIDRLNGLLVVTTQPDYLTQAKTWIERLDRAGTGEGGRRLHVYPVQNSKAENLAKLLNEIFGRAPARSGTAAPTVVGATATAQSTPGQPPGQQRAAATPTTIGGAGRGAAGLSQDVQVIADKDNNALVIYAAPEDYDVIEAAIKRLDVVQRQVLVDVIFAEVKLTGDLEFGIEWFLNAKAGRSVTGRLGASPAGSISPPASPSAVSAGTGLTLVKTVSGGQIGAILDLLEADSRANLVAAPSTMVADNHQATIKVGTRVPVQTQTQTGTTAGSVISSIQYVETGVLLDVTPRISSGSRVALDLNVEVSDAVVNRSSNIDSPEINNRSAKSTVTVSSGDTVVMAGLIRQDDSNSSAGLPGLAKLPVVGGLFGRQARSNDRTELVVLITPRVVNDSRQAIEFTEDLKRKMPELQEMISNATRRTSSQLRMDDSPLQMPESEAAPAPSGTVVNPVPERAR